jgi:hypothetical protein
MHVEPHRGHANAGPIAPVARAMEIEAPSWKRLCTRQVLGVEGTAPNRNDKGAGSIGAINQLAFIMGTWNGAEALAGNDGGSPGPDGGTIWDYLSDSGYVGFNFGASASGTRPGK